MSNNIKNSQMWSAFQIALLLLLSAMSVNGQTTFSSGSTGADGALNITAPGVTYLDPKAMHINAASDNIFHFTTITIASGSILKLSESRVHGPVYFLAQGDVIINGVIDLSGDSSPGDTTGAVEQIPVFAGSGGYSGGLGGIHGDPNHHALPGNGPGGGAAGDRAATQSLWAKGGTFTANRFLVPLVGGSGGGGNDDNGGVWGAQGGAGGGALLIASSTTIRLDGKDSNNGYIYARGGGGTGSTWCGGSGGAVRLVANSITGANSFRIYVDTSGGNCSVAPTPGLLRLEANSLTLFVNSGNFSGPYITSLPFALNLPTTPPPVITVVSVNGIVINANPFSFPDATINTNSPVPVVIQATNLPANATVTLYLDSDTSPNQAIPVTLTGNSQASTGTVMVTFPAVGTRGFVKATWGTLGNSSIKPQAKAAK